MKLKVLLLWLLIASGNTIAASSINGNEGVVIVDGVSNTPVSTAAPLPVTCITGCGGGGGGGGGDASAANQVIGNASLSSIDGKTPSLVSGRQPVDGSGVTQPVSAASLPLPTGASTSALQTTGNTKLDTINTTLGTPLQAGGNVVVTSAPTTAVTNAGLTNIDVALSTRLKPADTLTGVTTVGSVTAITNALPAGTNLLGKFGVDQTTPGTTDSVTVKAADGIGSLTETAPATDTASSGLNGRMQRNSQRLTSILTATTDGTQRTKVTDGTNDVVVTTNSTDGISGTTNRLGVTSNNKIWNGTTWDLGRGGITGTTSTFTGYFNTLQHGIYNSTRPTLTDGQGTNTQFTSRGALITSIDTRSAAVTVTPTVTASSAYTAGNEVGGLITFSSTVGIAGSGVVQSIRVTSKTVQTGTLKLYLFNINPSNTTWTDKTAPAINSADVTSVIGVYLLSAPDSGLGTHTIYNLDGIGKAFSIASGTSLYGILVTSGTPTWGSTSDVAVTVNILQD